MPHETNAPAPPAPDVSFNEQAAVAELAAANALAAQTMQGQCRAAELARTLDYDGVLSVDALETGIRFYQRRSVEALLECGKRLLLLRELAPRGEFERRVQELGFSARTAQRFMQAAHKVAQSARLHELGAKMKSASAFLELVTHDDDEDLDGLDADDLQAMSASELRAALREMRHERQAAQSLLQSKNERIQALEMRAELIARQREDERERLHLLDSLRQQSEARAQAVVGKLREDLLPAVQSLHEWQQLHGTDAGGGQELTVFMASLVARLQQEIDALRQQFHLPELHSLAQAELAGEVAQWAAPLRQTLEEGGPHADDALQLGGYALPAQGMAEGADADADAGAAIVALKPARRGGV